VHVLLERINPGYKRDLLKVKELLENGIEVTALKVVAKDNVGTVFVSKNQHVFGNKQTITKLVNEMPKTNEPGIVKNAEASLFVHQFKPRPRLFIFGAGPDVQPLVHMAEQAGFAVNIWDWRPALLNRKHFPNARLMEGGMMETISANRFTVGDSAVIMTHDFQRDREILQRMLEQKQMSYLGILGPRKRTSRLLDHKPIPDFLRSPVGMKIGAEGPEEIAVSIVAELIQTQRLAEEG
jgi:xanthine dehydrogenase accessory factor